MLHTSNERATEIVLFAGMCTRVRETLQRQNQLLLCNKRSVLSSVVYLQMITTFLESEANNFVWQQDGAPPHWHLSVPDWLDITVLDQWIDRKEPPDKSCIAWPPRSPDLTPCDFYLRWFIKDCMYVPPLPADLSD
ncbi:uncharacterized protein TNCV_2701721 [Trichonephila clavipes]|nr:uncharacterized protein TNCV_2701721 [Trichonephila clavipes]